MGPNSELGRLVTVVIEVEESDTENGLAIEELSNFLYHLKVTYAFILEDEILAAKYSRLLSRPHALVEGTVLREVLAAAQRRESWGFQKFRLFGRNLGERSLRIQELRYGSPFDLVLFGAAAILISLIVAGGSVTVEVPLVKFKVRLKPFGVGLQELRKVFQQGHPRSLPPKR